MNKTTLCAIAGLFVLPIFFSGAPSGAFAGQYNRVLSIGDAAPSWDDLPATDGRKIGWDDLSDAKAVVLVFTCNSCPYAVDLEARLKEFDQRYRSRGVTLVAVNVNKIPEDAMPAMKQKAEAAGFEFPYLFDASQKIAKQFGAKYTPECFVIDAKRSIVYMGAFDDSPDGKNVQQRYVDEAVQAILAGDKPKVTETVAIGCRIRMERERRRRKKP